jgi:hypothetical protein
MVNEKELASNEATAHAAHQLESPSAAKNFMLAGKAIFTLVSKKSGTRYTYKISHKDATEQFGESWMVSYLIGPDNWSNYKYIGQIKVRGSRGLCFDTTGKSVLSMESAPVAAINWTFNFVNAGKEPLGVEVWHAGKCGRCGRLLTVPSSIEMGLGPECASKGR